MGGSSLLKVLTTGIQDQRLYNKKTLYPFIKVWYKVTRYTTQWVRLDFENQPDFGRTAFCKLQRKGHLISRLLLVSNMPDIVSLRATALAKAKEQYPALGFITDQSIYPKVGWTNSLGHALCDRITLDIGGTRVEQLDSRLLEMLDEYNTPLEKVTVVNRLLPRNDATFGDKSVDGESTIISPTTRCVVPIPFWFTRGDPAAALPIDAIIADEVRVGITFRTIDQLIYTPGRSVNTSYDPGTGLWPFFGQNMYVHETFIPSYPATMLNLPLLSPANNSPIFGNPYYQKIDYTVPTPLSFPMGDTYLLAEYVYLDKSEANRLRVSDLQVPIVQHYAMKPMDTNGLPRAILPLDVPNPTRDLFWMFNRVEAPSYNNYFLSSRDLRNPGPDFSNGTQYNYLWWPNSQGLSPIQPGTLLPGFASRNSEPITGLAIMYEGSLVRAQTNNPPLFRGILPSYQQVKTPWLNGYYYNFSFGVQNGKSPISKPRGHANLDKIRKREMYFEFNPNAGCASNPNNVPRYVIYCWAETYNIFRVYGGRAGCLFAY